MSANHYKSNYGIISQNDFCRPEYIGKADQQHSEFTKRRRYHPFISRYRKEVTGGLDEVQIENIKNQYDKLCETAKRKETILSTISEQGKLNRRAAKTY